MPLATRSQISAVLLSYLIHRQTPGRPHPCRVCGSVDVRPGAVYGRVTEFVCHQARHDYTEALVRDHRHRRIGTDAAEFPTHKAHHARSKQKVELSRGDDAVRHALLELRELRTAAGEDMDVPVGTIYRPPGKPPVTHIGDDEWVAEPGA